MSVLDLVLVLLIAAQQAFFMWQIQKLIDKAMSRSYTEYIQATEPPKPPRIRVDEDVPEDLGPLREYEGITI